MESTNMSGQDWERTNRQLRNAAVQERHKNEKLARQLSKEAMQQWQRTIEGLLALPTAAALGMASSTLYVAAFIERGFEVLQQSAEAARSGIEEGRREMRSTGQGEDERRGDGNRGQNEAGRGEVHA